MANEFLCAYRTQVCLGLTGAHFKSQRLFCFGLSFARIVNFLYEMLSLTWLVNKGTFIVFSITSWQLKLFGRLSSIVWQVICLLVRTWTHNIELKNYVSLKCNHLQDYFASLTPHCVEFKSPFNSVFFRDRTLNAVYSICDHGCKIYNNRSIQFLGVRG